MKTVVKFLREIAGHYYYWRYKEMAVIYATLIVKGRRTFDSVPNVIKPQVYAVLTDIECLELAGDYTPSESN
jgi:hypothetical protein